MKFSTHRFHRASRSKLMAAAGALLAVVSIVGATAGTANAAKPRPPRPTPTPIAIPVVPAPPTVSVSVEGTLNFFVLVTENPVNYDFDLSVRHVSGQLPPPPAYGVSWTALPGPGQVVINGLLPGVDYVFDLIRIRRGIQPVTSPGTRFSFRTPADPRTVTLTAPQNVRARLAGSSDTTLIDWDAVPGAATYEFTIDGVNFTRICFPDATYCPQEGSIPPSASLASASLVGKQFRVRAVGFVPAGGGARPLGPLSAPLAF